MVGVRVRRISLFVIAILVVTVSMRPLESDSATSVPPPVLIQQTITMTVNDGQGTFPPVPIGATQQLQVSDAAGIFPPVTQSASESLQIADSAGVFPPVGVSQSASLQVSDTAGVFPPQPLSSSASITVTDTASVVVLVTLTIAGTGDGSGKATSLGIDCRIDGETTSVECSQTVAQGTVFILNAAADAGSAFGGWTGCGSTAGPTCIIVVNEDTTVTADFDDLVIVKPVVASPPRVEAPFRIDIVADDVTDLAGADLSLGYDPAVLEFIGARLGPAFDDCSNQSLHTGSAVNLAMVCSDGRSGTNLPLWIVTFVPKPGTTSNLTTLTVADVVLGHDGDSPGHIPSLGESTVVEIVLGVCGDVNSSGVVDIVDLILSMRMIVGLIDPTLTQVILGDLNENGKVDAIDVIIGLQYLVGIIPTLDSCGPPPDPGVILAD
jgi:hypothetical protein